MRFFRENTSTKSPPKSRDNLAKISFMFFSLFVCSAPKNFPGPPQFQQFGVPILSVLGGNEVDMLGSTEPLGALKSLTTFHDFRCSAFFA